MTRRNNYYHNWKTLRRYCFNNPKSKQNRNLNAITQLYKRYYKCKELCQNKGNNQIEDFYDKVVNNPYSYTELLSDCMYDKYDDLKGWFRRNSTELLMAAFSVCCGSALFGLGILVGDLPKSTSTGLGSTLFGLGILVGDLPNSTSTGLSQVGLGFALFGLGILVRYTK